MTETFEEPAWTLNTVVPDIEPGTLNAVFGKPGSGKTSLGLQWAVALAGRGRLVVWLDLSETAGVIARRWEACQGSPGGFVYSRVRDSSEWQWVLAQAGRGAVIFVDYLQMAGDHRQEELLRDLAGAVKGGVAAVVMSQASSDRQAEPDSAKERELMTQRLLATPLGLAADHAWLIHPAEGPLHEMF